MIARTALRAGLGALLLAVAGLAPLAADAATKIERVVSPGGVEAWLVEEHSIPIVAIEAAFPGGARAEPADKAGLAGFVAGLLDEGAGDLDSQAFQARLEAENVSLRFDAGLDHMRVSMRSLATGVDAGFELLRLALNEPRFDEEPIERVRGQFLVNLARNAEDPDRVASRAWWRAAFGDHAYGRGYDGTRETVAAIGAEDLRALHPTLLNRRGLKIAVVGAITAEELGPLLDRTFGALPDEDRPAEADIAIMAEPGLTVIERDIPQSVVSFGLAGLKRDDPDFVPAYVMNYILGGGGFSSRLTEEVREKRGLAYSVYSYLAPLDLAGVMIGGVATDNARVAESLGLIRAELARMAEEGVPEDELMDAKTYLTGSYPLRFDSNAKIAQQLVAIQLDGLGIDYVETRNDLIDAVTTDDVARVAKRLLAPDQLIIVIVGAPEGV